MAWYSSFAHELFKGGRPVGHDGSFLRNRCRPFTSSLLKSGRPVTSYGSPSSTTAQAGLQAQAREDGGSRLHRGGVGPLARRQLAAPLALVETVGGFDGLLGNFGNRLTESGDLGAGHQCAENVGRCDLLLGRRRLGGQPARPHRLKCAGEFRGLPGSPSGFRV